ncbi:MULTISPECIES: LysR family transcriptional regulator [Gammaproteobacteria]|uniref:LysR family transcriptional regulator n=1 Tax=Gammaproteobacteria TaxID=1236 RepID=UPI000DD0C59A|nr:MULTISPECIES: LysR family transcriptional regulator [Gammaproteobacteria]RTE85785.1 LysR family transcriptional regulator [Aliidiomarina sp. B3213]TCZ90212.1 LysR family transcriptional regulator [Lysobacter sp. N42]
MQDLTNFALFAQVVEAGSISAAARSLNMPKSTLSRRISQLEEHLGVRLIHRTTRKLELTDIGREVLIHCKSLSDAANAAELVTQVAKEKPSGRIRVSCPYAISQSLLVQVLPEFMAMYPQVSIDLITTNQPVNLIEDHIDIALRVRPTIEDSALIARRIIASPSSLFAHPEFIMSMGRPSHPADLVTWPCLSMHQSSGRYQWQLSHSSGEKYVVRYQASLITDDMWMLKAAASEKLGVVSLPNYLCQEEEAKGVLKRVLPEWRLPTGIMHLVYPSRRGMLPAVRSLIEFLVEKLPDAAGAVGIHRTLS